MTRASCTLKRLPFAFASAPKPKHYTTTYPCMYCDQSPWTTEHTLREQMQQRSGSTPDSGQRRGRASSIVRWWSSPTGFQSDRRLQIWIVLPAASLLFVVTVASTSLWNYYCLSLPVPKPSTDITASDMLGSLASIDRPSGNVAWQFDTGEPMTAPPTTADGAIYIVSGVTVDTGVIASVTAAEGSPLWRTKLNSIADYPPVVAGDMVFVGTRAGDLIAFDRHTGETVWISDLGSSVVGSPIVKAGILYIASNAVYAIDAATGKQLWRHTVGGDVSRPIRLSDQVISAISSDGNVNLISAENGRRRLTFPLWFSTSAAPIVAGTALVIPGDRAFVQALDIDERDVPMEKAIRFWWTKLWLWDMAPHPPLPRAYLWQNRTIGGDTAYALGADDYSVFLGVSEVDGSGTVVALDLSTGQVRWETPAASKVFSPAILTDDSLILGIEGAGALAIDKLTGTLLWELDVQGGLSAAPTLSKDGTILLPTADGVLRAIH